MKKRLIAIVLVLISILALSTSTLLCRFDFKRGPTQIGFPAYVTIEYEDYPVEYETSVYLEVENMVLAFIILGVPIFLSGYLWGTSKKKSPNQALEPTRSDAD